MTTQDLKADVKKTLTDNILPFWMYRMIDPFQGGFYGQMNGQNHLKSDADKGGILNARILWSFSSAYLQEKSPIYLEMADRAKTYILKHFFDPEFGGTLDCFLRWKAYRYKKTDLFTGFFPVCFC